MESTVPPRSTFIRADDASRLEVTVYGDHIDPIVDHFTAYLAASGYDRSRIATAFSKAAQLLKGQQKAGRSAAGSAIK